MSPAKPPSPSHGEPLRVSYRPTIQDGAVVDIQAARWSLSLSRNGVGTWGVVPARELARLMDGLVAAEDSLHGFGVDGGPVARRLAGAVGAELWVCGREGWTPAGEEAR